MARLTSALLLLHLAVALISPHIVAANRESSDVGGASFPTSFASCICQKIATDQSGTAVVPAILVTKAWDLGMCNLHCPSYCLEEKAPFLQCLQVHTATGNTGGQIAKHIGVRANTIPDREEAEPDGLLPLVRHETYYQEQLFAACVCKYPTTQYQFLFGLDVYMGGLQIWGRTGCPKSCGSECGKMGAEGSFCLPAEVTDDEDEPSDTTGYKRKTLSLNMQKRKKKIENKVEGS